MPKIKFSSADLLFGTVFNHMMTFLSLEDFCLVQCMEQTSCLYVWPGRSYLVLSGHHSHMALVLYSSVFTNLSLFDLGDTDVTNRPWKRCVPWDKVCRQPSLPPQAQAEELTLVTMLSASQGNADSEE